MSLSTSPPRKKTHHEITTIQRKALRDWYNDDSKDKVTQNNCRMWWKREYNYVPGSASISEILSSKYAYLDDKEEASSIKREVIPKWPVLEDTLFEWEQRYEQASLTVNADVLRTKATELWNKLPQYEGIPTPKWSNGWLDRLKRRRGLKQRIHHGEAGSADQSENV